MQFLLFLLMSPFFMFGSRGKAAEDDGGVPAKQWDSIWDLVADNAQDDDRERDPEDDGDGDGEGGVQGGLGSGADDVPSGEEAGAPLIRLGDANYSDGVGAIDADLPNAREISNIVSQQDGDVPNSAGLSDFFWAWGQFIDHDMGLTPAGEGGEEIAIVIPEGDPQFEAGSEITFTRVTPNDGTGVDGPREFTNEITSILDASMVYGSDAVTEEAVSSCPYLAMQQNGLPRDEDGNLVAGDVRAGENVALSSMHELFVREHNRLVEELRESDPSLTDEELFEGARLRLEIEVQAITYNEWLPLLVGENAIAEYEGYDPEVDPSIAVEFSGAAFRFGHTLLSAEIERLNEDGSDIDGGALSLREAFFNPDILAEGGGIDPVIRGLAGSHAQELDTMIVEDVRSFLIGEDGTQGLDLAALNIMRGRDLGIESYNDLRETLGLERVTSFDEISSDPEIAGRLEEAYGDVDLVDAWVGGLAEDPVEGGVVGETFAIIIIDQFTRLRDGDEGWGDAEGLIPADELAELQETTLADIVLANTGIEALQDDIFIAHERIGGTDEGDILVGSEVRDLVFGLSGDDTLDGAAGDDVVQGGEGDDVLSGGEGDDDLQGGAGSDVLDGGAGDDLLEGGDGMDLFTFGAGSGSDVILDFDGEDMISLDLDDDGAFDPGLIEETEDGAVVTLADGTTITVADALAEEVAAAIIVV